MENENIVKTIQEQEPIDKKKAYMRKYMADRYRANPLFAKKYRASGISKQKYEVPQEIYEIVREDLSTLIKINQLIKELNKGSLEYYLVNRHNFDFPKKD
jgi:hypothetical protein